MRLLVLFFVMLLPATSSLGESWPQRKLSYNEQLHEDLGVERVSYTSLATPGEAQPWESVTVSLDFPPSGFEKIGIMDVKQGYEDEKRDDLIRYLRKKAATYGATGVVITDMKELQTTVSAKDSGARYSRRPKVELEYRSHVEAIAIREASKVGSKAENKKPELGSVDKKP
jgi:hypothetical protein